MELDEKQLRVERARVAGKAAHASGNAHKFNAQTAAAAGHKGGTKVSQDRAHMSAIGRKGALANRLKKEAKHGTQDHGN